MYQGPSTYTTLQSQLLQSYIKLFDLSYCHICLSASQTWTLKMAKTGIIDAYYENHHKAIQDEERMVWKNLLWREKMVNDQENISNALGGPIQRNHSSSAQDRAR